MKAKTPSVAVIGFGEAGSSLCIGWNRKGVRSFDIKQTNPNLKVAKCAEMQDHGVEAVEDLGAAVDGADLVFSTVTADQAFAAASSAALWLKSGAFFFDLNSCGDGNNHPKLSPHADADMRQSQHRCNCRLAGTGHGAKAGAWASRAGLYHQNGSVCYDERY